MNKNKETTYIIDPEVMKKILSELKGIKLDEKVDFEYLIKHCPSIIKHLEEIEDYETLIGIKKEGFTRTK